MKLDLLHVMSNYVLKEMVIYGWWVCLGASNCFLPLEHAFQETMKCQNTGNLLIRNKIDGGLLKCIAPFVSRVEN